jgi:hypothetical protein
MKKTINVKTFKKSFFGNNNKTFNSVAQRLESKSFPHLKTYLNRNIARTKAE